LNLAARHGAAPPLAPGAVRAAVVDLVIGDAACASRAAAALSAADAWDGAIADASRWGVVTLLHARLNGAIRPPEAVTVALRLEALRAELRSRRVLERSLDVLQLFAQARIDAVAIKGVGAIGTLGARAAARTTNDLDVVVRERDAGWARALLRARGYSEINPPFERHMEDIALSPQLHNVARTLRKDELEVDVHWRFGPRPPPALDAERIIGRAIGVTIGTTAFRAAHPVDAVLIAVHHALRSSFVPENTVRDLFDLGAWWDDGRVPASLGELVEAAIRSGLATSLLALWATVLRRNPDHPLRSGYEWLRASLDAKACGEAALLERHFEQTLLHGNPARFTLEVFAPRVYARWLFGTLVRSLRPAPQRKEDAVAAAARRPLTMRIANVPARCGRIAREMLRLRSLASYRAIARAQSRFH
jgi:putative nucleotidyltransferase-like protein